MMGTQLKMMVAQAFVLLSQDGHASTLIQQQETQQHAHQYAGTAKMSVLKYVTMETYLIALDA